MKILLEEIIQTQQIEIINGTFDTQQFVNSTFMFITIKTLIYKECYSWTDRITASKYYIECMQT